MNLTIERTGGARGLAMAARPETLLVLWLFFGGFSLLGFSKGQTVGNTFSNQGAAVVRARKAKGPLPVLATNTVPLRRWEHMAFKGIVNVPVPAATGDLNGDGFADVVIAAAPENGGHGLLAVFYGGASGLAVTPDWTTKGREEDEAFGYEIAVGDVNGDGFADLIACNQFENTPPEKRRVAARIFFGSRAGLSEANAQAVLREAGDFWLGGCVYFVGDLNGDGRQDVIFSASDRVQDEAHPDGALLLFYGRDGGLGGVPDRVIRSEHPNAGLGPSIGCAGDVNGDGYNDLYLAAMRFSGRHKDGGKAYVYHGSPTGIGLKPSWTCEYPARFFRNSKDGDTQFFSFGMGAAGDVNGDGYDDLVVGAPLCCA